MMSNPSTTTLPEAKRFFLAGKTLAFFLISLVQSSFAQEKIGEINIEGQEVADFSTAVHANGLFVNLEFKGSAPNTIQQYWIDEKNVLAVGHEPLKGKALCGIITKGDTIDYYFYTRDKKAVALNLYRTHSKSRFTELRSLNLRTDIKFLGSYVDKNLVLLFSSPETFSIRLIEMEGLVAKPEKRFQVPNDLLAGKDKFLFLDEGTRPRLNQVQALNKIYKVGNELIFTADLPYEDYNEKRTSYKTTLTRLDLATGKTTVKFFVEDRKIPFHTVVFGNYLFRMFDYNILDVFDLATGVKLTSMEFDPKKFFVGMPQYARDGKKGIISKRLDDDKLFVYPSTAFLNIDSVKGNIVLTVGRSAERGGIFIAGGLVQMLASIAITAIRNSMEPKNLVTYYYLVWDTKNRFEWKQELKGVDQRVDEYEMGRFAGVKFKLKAYAEDSDFLYGFYERPATGVIEIVKFYK